MTESTAREIMLSFYGDGKPPMFVGLAVLIASTAEDLGDLLKVLVGRKASARPLPPVPPLRDWLPMYYSHRLMWDGLAKVIGLSSEIPLSSVLGEVRRASRMKVPEQEGKDTLESVLKEYPELASNLALLLRGVPFPPSDEVLKTMLVEFDNDSDSSLDETRGFDVFMLSRESQFFLRVWLPCWIMYRTYPPLLMWNARRGCFDSLEKLVRLDKSVAGDRLIGERLHRLLHGTNRRSKERISRALAQGPRGRLDIKNIKLGLSGMISQVARAMHCPVTAPEIATLFHDIERVRTGMLEDRHIAAGETFAKAIQRNRNWPSIAS